jgi:hypothetical protein
VEIARTPNGRASSGARACAGGELRRVDLPPVGVEADDVQRERLDELAGVAQGERRLRLAAGLGAQRRRVERQDGQVGGLGRLTGVAARHARGDTTLGHDVTPVLRDPRPHRAAAPRRDARCRSPSLGRAADGGPPLHPAPVGECGAAPQEACPALPEGAGSGTRPVAPRRGPRRARARDAAGVIHDVDQALRALIRRDAVTEADVDVVFDAPTKDWAGRRNSPTIDVYLYDIREDMRRRERGQVNEYDGAGRVVGRHLPPRHFKLSYLVTAWTQRPEDEHRLLSSLLACFLRHDAIPADLLGPAQTEIGLPVPLTVGLPPPEDRAFADVWSALGGELKPSLDIVVTTPVPTGQQRETGPPVTAPPRVAVSGNGDGGWPGTETRAGRMPADPAATAGS